MYISTQISKNSLYTYMSLLKGICMRIGGSQIAQLAASCAISLPFFLKHIPFNNDIILTDIGSSFHPEPIIFHFIFQRERSVCAVCSTICTFCSLMRYLRSPSFFQMTQIVSASYFWWKFTYFHFWRCSAQPAKCAGKTFNFWKFFFHYLQLECSLKYFQRKLRKL